MIAPLVLSNCAFNLCPTNIVDNKSHTRRKAFGPTEQQKSPFTIPSHAKSLLDVGEGGVGVGTEESSVTMHGADPHTTPAASMLEVQQSSPVRSSPRSEHPVPPHVPQLAYHYRWQVSRLPGEVRDRPSVGMMLTKVNGP